MPMTRRRLLLAAALLPVLTVGTTGVLAIASGEQTSAEASPEKHPAAPVIPASTTAGAVVQIVAHPDDDLFFMNPDLSRSLTAGVPLTTVYLTSGEADGRNEAAGGAAKDPEQPADRAHYAEARQNGIRCAYAQMVTGDRTSAWQRTVVPTVGGGQAEVDVLVGHPQINLVWLQMREARTTTAETPQSLRGLWNGEIPALEAQLASGSPVTQPFTYTKDQVVQVIAGVLTKYRPTTIRMQDPTPGREQLSGKYTDHQDHMYGARFVQAGYAAYARQISDRPHFAIQNYLGYHTGSLPHALDPQTAETKIGYLKTYAWLDHENYCGSVAGCGDRKVAGSPTGRNWAQSLRYARADNTSWMTEGALGRLHAFAALDGRLALWTREPSGSWTGPTLLPGEGIDPGVFATRLPDGRITVVATRTSFGQRGKDYLREVVTLTQSAPGGPFGAWQSLGTPEAADETGTSAISAPAAVVGADGRLTVYLRDSHRTLRAAVQQPSGAFGEWQHLGGADLQSDPVVAVDAAGRRHVYGTTTTSVLAWTQASPDAPLQGPFQTNLPATTVPITAAPDSAGVRIYFRRPDSGVVRSALVTAGPGKPEVSAISESGGRAGYGAVGVAGRLVAGRADTGTVSTTSIGGPPAWAESAMLYTGAPSAALDRTGGTTTAVLGLDAALHTTTTPPTGTPRPTWHPAVFPLPTPRP